MVNNPDQAYTVRFSPDGKSLASAHRNGIAILWDVATGRQKVTFQGHTAQVEGVAISPDGKTVATASWDQTVRLWTPPPAPNWRPSKGTRRRSSAWRSPPTARSWPSAAAFWDGKDFAPKPAEIKLWDLASRAEVATMTGHANHVFAIAFSPDSKVLASGGHDRTIRLWDGKTGAALDVLGGQAARRGPAADHRDGPLARRQGRGHRRRGPGDQPQERRHRRPPRDPRRPRRRRRLPGVRARRQDARLGRATTRRSSSGTSRRAGSRATLSGHTNWVLAIGLRARRQDAGLGRLRQDGPALGRRRGQGDRRAEGAHGGGPRRGLRARRQDARLRRHRPDGPALGRRRGKPRSRP